MLQFRVRATDDGNPAQFTEVNVQVSVQRVEIPIISQPFQNTIREDTQNGVSVLTVNASHPLGVSCHCLYFIPYFCHSCHSGFWVDMFYHSANTGTSNMALSTFIRICCSCNCFRN